MSETRTDAGVRLQLIGELDLASTPELRERLRQLREECVSVSIDLSELNFMDSSGIGALLHAALEAEADGRPLNLLPDMTPQVRRVFSLTGADSYLLRRHSGHSSTD